MMYWVLNSAIIPADGWGRYEYRPATRQELALALAGRHESRLGYPETADAIQRWTGVRPVLSREVSWLAPRDVAYVVRLRYRITDPATKGARLEPRESDWEIGRLERLA